MANTLSADGNFTCISGDGGASAPPAAAGALSPCGGLDSVVVVVLVATLGEDIGGDVGTGMVGCDTLVGTGGCSGPGVGARGRPAIGAKRPGGNVMLLGSLGCMLDLVTDGGLITASAAVTCPKAGGVAGRLVGVLDPTSVNTAGLGGDRTGLVHMGTRKGGSGTASCVSIELRAGENCRRLISGPMVVWLSCPSKSIQDSSCDSSHQLSMSESSCPGGKPIRDINCWNLNLAALKAWSS